MSLSGNEFQRNSCIWHREDAVDHSNRSMFISIIIQLETESLEYLENMKSHFSSNISDTFYDFSC